MIWNCLHDDGGGGEMCLLQLRRRRQENSTRWERMKIKNKREFILYFQFIERQKFSQEKTNVWKELFQLMLDPNRYDAASAFILRALCVTCIRGLVRAFFGKLRLFWSSQANPTKNSGQLSCRTGMLPYAYSYFRQNSRSATELS